MGMLCMSGKAGAMKQNEFIQLVVNELAKSKFGSKYSKYCVEKALWAVMRKKNPSNEFTKNEESFVRRTITSLVLGGNKGMFNYTLDDVKNAIITAIREVTE